MATLLQEVFSEEEIPGISPHLAQKFEQYAQTKKGAIQNLEGEIEKIKSDYGKVNYNSLELRNTVGVRHVQWKAKYSFFMQTCF